MSNLSKFLGMTAYCMSATVMSLPESEKPIFMEQISPENLKEDEKREILIACGYEEAKSGDSNVKCRALRELCVPSDILILFEGE